MLQDVTQMCPRCPKLGPRWLPEGSMRQSPPRNPRAKVCIFLRFWKGERHPVWKKPYVLCLPCTGGQDGAQGTVRRAKELKRRVSFCAAKNTLRGHFLKAIFLRCAKTFKNWCVFNIFNKISFFHHKQRRRNQKKNARSDALFTAFS